MQVRLKMEFEAERQVAYWSTPEEGSYWLRPRWIAVKMVKCIQCWDIFRKLSKQYLLNYTHIVYKQYLWISYEL